MRWRWLDTAFPPSDLTSNTQEHGTYKHVVFFFFFLKIVISRSRWLLSSLSLFFIACVSFGIDYLHHKRHETLYDHTTNKHTNNQTIDRPSPFFLSFFLSLFLSRLCVFLSVSLFFLLRTTRAESSRVEKGIYTKKREKETGEGRANQSSSPFSSSSITEW